jgi:hypothetical protein
VNLSQRWSGMLIPVHGPRGARTQSFGQSIQALQLALSQMPGQAALRSHMRACECADMCARQVAGRALYSLAVFHVGVSKDAAIAVD